MRDVSTPTAVGQSALDGVCFRDEYDSETLVADSRTFLGSSGYPEYPVRTVETSDALFLLEGRIYDVDDERRHLRTVGSSLLNERVEDVAGWLRERDGDFLVLAYDRTTGTVSMVNDAFSRLPVYYATFGDGVVLSRELKFVRSLARHYGDPLELDSLAVAQHLLFGYQLGDRTLFEGVSQVPPGSYVQIGDGVDVQCLHRHDFERSAHANRSVEENAAALADRFEEACANRDVEGLPNVLSLSGGLDSRAVGGGYSAAGRSFTAATFEQPDGQNEADVRFAERIANALGAEWECYRAEETASHRAELLDMKQGMNFLGMSFILEFFEQLRDRHGPMVYVTGDGGDKALPDLTPPRGFASRRDLAEYLVDAHSVFDPDEAAEVAGVEPEALVRSVEARLDSYPESSFDALYVHFLVRERGMNWLNHGEDRNRYYFWSVSPFYSLPFFRYAMNVPAGQKSRSKLYTAFLKELDPELCDIENANYGVSITSLRHTIKQFGVSLAKRYPGLKRTLVSLLDDGKRDGLVDVLSREVRRTDRTPLADEKVEEVLRNDEDYDGREFYNLLTVLSTDNVAPPRPAVEDATPQVFPDGSGRPDDVRERQP